MVARHGTGFYVVTDYEKHLRKPTMQNHTRGMLYDAWGPIKGNISESDALNMYELLHGIIYSWTLKFQLMALFPGLCSR